MNRRHFLSLTAKLSLAAAGGYGLAQFDSAYHCAVTRQEVALRGLPPAFDGFRIALMSDFHHSSWIPATTLRVAVNRANQLQPDLIALTGDFIHWGKDWVEGCFRELSHLRAPFGVLAVLGNHDHTGKAAPLVRLALRQAGIQDLTNTGVSLRRDSQSLWVGGVGDLWRERQKIRTAMSGARGADSAILLSHNPDFAETLKDPRVGLVLSGHTHGGQCVLPIIGAPLHPLPLRHQIPFRPLLQPHHPSLRHPRRRRLLPTRPHELPLRDRPADFKKRSRIKKLRRPSASRQPASDR